jgi:hypothetical protein
VIADSLGHRRQHLQRVHEERTRAALAPSVAPPGRAPRPPSPRAAPPCTRPARPTMTASA